MALIVRVDHAERLRHSVASGTLTDAELVDVYANMLSDPAFDPTLDHLVDLTGVDRFEVSLAAIRGLAAIMALADGALPAGTRRRVAFVATSPEALATALLYRTRRIARESGQPSPVEIQCFRSVAAARTWLGKPVR